MREKVGKSRNTVFPMICGFGGSKSRLAKAAGAEPSGQMRDEKLHAVVARSLFPSQNVQNTPCSDYSFCISCSAASSMAWPNLEARIPNMMVSQNRHSKIWNLIFGNEQRSSRMVRNTRRKASKVWWFWADDNSENDTITTPAPSNHHLGNLAECSDHHSKSSTGGKRDVRFSHTSWHAFNSSTLTSSLPRCFFATQNSNLTARVFTLQAASKMHISAGCKRRHFGSCTDVRLDRS